MAATEAVLYVQELETMATFYERCFGMRPVADADGYRGLSSEEWTIWLLPTHAAPDAAQTVASHDTPRRRSNAPLKLCLPVENIDAIRPLITELGGRIDARTWEFAGSRRCDVVDPEGNVLQLLERLV